MNDVDSKIEHPSVQQQIMLEVLRDNNKVYSNFMEQFAHLKNEKSMLKLE